MKKTLSILAAAALMLVACQNNEKPVADGALVRIDPVITRALTLNFNKGNQIGVNIIKQDQTLHAENACLTNNGVTFEGELKWYATAEPSTVQAYYPYQTTGFPETFSVALDQTAGTDGSDFMIATETEVYPSARPLMMKFRHQFSQLVVVLDNKAEAPVTGVTFKNINPVATISVEGGEYSVAADATAEKADIKCEEIVANLKYAAVVVPQTLENLGVIVDVAGVSLASGIAEAELRPGYSYTINVEVLSDMVNVSISGEIEDWEDGGSLNGGEYEVPFEEFEGYFEYDGLRYNTVTFSNGETWMAEPLAYLPLGKTVSNNPADKSTGVWYPYAVEEGVAVVKTDAATIKANGYLYSFDTIFGTKITDANFLDFENCQGICPKGWHIPSRAQWFNLCGNSNACARLGEKGTQTNPDALFYNAALSSASVADFNNAGFNFTFSGTISNDVYNTLVVDSNVCTVEEYYGANRMAYIASSTANTATQFFALMTTFNAGVNSVGKVSLSFATLAKTGVQVRCVKDAPAAEAGE